MKRKEEEKRADILTNDSSQILESFRITVKYPDSGKQSISQTAEAKLSNDELALLGMWAKHFLHQDAAYIAV